jgi:hypothetical protein
MATIPDMQLIPTAYTEVYAATGITPGTKIAVQNKARGDINIQNIDAQPAATDNNGFVISSKEVWPVPAGTLKVWFKGDGPMAVEVM